MKRKGFVLLPIVILASCGLIVINYYTIKTLSAARAYINGESEYSKGQKDALLYLSTYIQTGDENYWNLFNKAILVPISDNLARHSMLEGKNDDIACSYFIVAKNNVKDVHNMVWLFKRFGNSIMKKPISLWSDAEPLIDELNRTGIAVHDKIQSKAIDQAQKEIYLKKISAISTDLYQKESDFSQSLGEAVRLTNKYLLLSNILCIFIVIIAISLYAVMMITQLKNSNKTLAVKNDELNSINKEMDTLVYTVSHDLRTPLASISGIIDLSNSENDPKVLREYIELIGAGLEKQNSFISEIFDFYKNKKLGMAFKNISLSKLIDGIITNNCLSPAAQGIIISKNIELDEVYSDELRLKLIINNLVSNAIKYSDNNKPEKRIFISTRKQNNYFVIELEDNGVGIAEKYISKIYEMFFVANNTDKGTGLGLYILKQNIESLKGSVEVSSVLGQGTKFTVFIPLIGERQGKNNPPIPSHYQYAKE